MAWEDVLRRRRRSRCRIYMVSFGREDRNRKIRSKVPQQRRAHFQYRAGTIDGIAIYANDDEELVYFDYSGRRITLVSVEMFEGTHSTFNTYRSA